MRSLVSAGVPAWYLDAIHRRGDNIALTSSWAATAAGAPRGTPRTVARRLLDREDNYVRHTHDPGAVRQQRRRTRSQDVQATMARDSRRARGRACVGASMPVRPSLVTVTVRRRNANA